LPPLVPVTSDQFSLRQDSGMPGTAGVRGGISGIASLGLPLDGRETRGRIAGPDRRRCAHPLLQRSWRLFDLRGDDRRGFVSLNRVLVRSGADMVANAVLLRLRGARPLRRLAR